MRRMKQEMPRTVILAFGLLVAAAATAWWACGDSGSSAEGCNPPCTADQVCVDGRCVAADDGGGEADAAPEAEAEADAVEEVVEEVVEDAAVESDFSPVDGSGDGDARSDADPSTYNVGEACTGDGDCVGPGDATCMTTVALPIIGAIDFAGGYCTSTCDPADAASCGTDSVCVDLSFVGWVGCFQSCTPGTPGECRESEGYTCFDPSSMPYIPIPGPVCIPQLY
ncbi:MAG: hypothetical protein HY905_19320 [Deltaproteobacteria bacterium]|nr:hypothetical protein [Deltaproteobacteria bacterium]